MGDVDDVEEELRPLLRPALDGNPTSRVSSSAALPSNNFVAPNMQSVATSLLASLVSGPKPRDTPKPYEPGMTSSQQIEQLSREDPNYGSTVKAIQQGQAAKALVYNGGDPFTTYAVMHLAGVISDYIHGRKQPQQKPDLSHTALTTPLVGGVTERALVSQMLKN